MWENSSNFVMLLLIPKAEGLCKQMCSKYQTPTCYYAAAYPFYRCHVKNTTMPPSLHVPLSEPCCMVWNVTLMLAEEGCSTGTSAGAGDSARAPCTALCFALTNFGSLKQNAQQHGLCTM